MALDPRKHGVVSILGRSRSKKKKVEVRRVLKNNVERQKERRKDGVS